MQVGKSEELRQWTRKVIEKMPHLTKPQAVVLAMWSFGIVMTQSSGLTTVSVFLAELLGKKENTVRQQLREWLTDAEDKTKTGRASLNVTSCFSPLLCWILSLWSPGEKRLALAADATTYAVRFTILAISVVRSRLRNSHSLENSRSNQTRKLETALALAIEAYQY